MGTPLLMYVQTDTIGVDNKDVTLKYVLPEASMQNTFKNALETIAEGAVDTYNTEEYTSDQRRAAEGLQSLIQSSEGSNRSASFTLYRPGDASGHEEQVGLFDLVAHYAPDFAVEETHGDMNVPALYVRANANTTGG